MDKADDIDIRWSSKLNDSIIRDLCVAKEFINEKRISHMDFSSSGEMFVTSSESDEIVVYDAERGTLVQTLFSRKYGVEHIYFTHSTTAVVYSSTKDDTFISGSVDKSLRLWDLRSPVSEGLMHLHDKPVAAFDPEGLIFAVGSNNDTVKLYDLRSFDMGAFSAFKLPYGKENEWTCIKFSPNGKLIMICSHSPVIRLIDSFSGKTLHSLTGHTNNHCLELEASFSPDSQYVFSGSEDGSMHVWSVKTGLCVGIFKSDHLESVNCVKFNPKYIMMASACIRLFQFQGPGIEMYMLLGMERYSN